MRPYGHLRLGEVFAGLALGFLAVSSASAVDLKEGVEQLAAQLAESVPEQKQVRVAVTDFPDLQGVTSDLGRYIAERLNTRLSRNPKFFVIERRRLGQVLVELKFSMSDLVDQNKAKQLGRMLGVEALVVGSLSDLGNVVDVDARIIQIETNQMMPGATTSISKDQVVKEMLERGRITSAPSPSVGTLTPATPAQPEVLFPEQLRRFSFENGTLALQLLEIKKEPNGDIRLVFDLTNRLEKPEWFGIHWDTPGYLLDDMGKTSPVVSTSFRVDGARQLLPAGHPVKWWIRFRAPEAGATVAQVSIWLLRVNPYGGAGWDPVEVSFVDVPLPHR